MEAGLRRGAGLTVPRLELLEKERTRHPESILKALEGLRLGEDRRAPAAKSDAPELGRVLRQIADRLEIVEACAETIFYALDGGGCPASALMTTLQGGVLDRLQEAIEALRGTVSAARYQDGVMAVVEGQAQAQEAS